MGSKPRIGKVVIPLGVSVGVGVTVEVWWEWRFPVVMSKRRSVMGILALVFREEGFQQSWI